jgi:two-component system, chemotaxis family, protein-glutamate methylesterase/glutaminase
VCSIAQFTNNVEATALLYDDRMDKRTIIVIGASAGGIEAIRQFLQLLPADLDASLFVVVHLSPQTPSYLARVLQRNSLIRVVCPGDGDVPEKSTVYVAPANRHLLLKPGVIRLGSGPRENRSRPSVDALFRTAAFAYQERVIGIIFSGALNDGTAGLMTIKSFGGVAIVQDPEEASFSGMPKSALEFVQVDYVLPIVGIAKKVIELTKDHEKDQSDPGSEQHRKEAKNTQIYQTGNDGLRSGMDGEQVPLTCPECGGSLWQTETNRFKEFKCHVGHSFTAETLLQEQADAIDAQFWKNLRQLEENVWLRRKLADWARTDNRVPDAQNQEKLAHVAELQAESIRQALLSDVNRLDEPSTD